MLTRSATLNLKSFSSPNTAVTIIENTEDIVEKQEDSPVASSSKVQPPPISTPDAEDTNTHTKVEDLNLVQTPRKTKKNTLKRKETDDSSPRKTKTIRLALDTAHPTPEHWKEVYAAIKDMRKHGGAPVDEMGCHMAGGPVEDPKTKRFVILISLMLSSQTKDEVTHVAVKNLRTSLGELTANNLASADDSIIAESIGKVGFWRRKTQYIKQAAKKILDEFDGEIPDTLEGLCSLPGVGPKMAFLALQVAWNRSEGIGVDVHVHRITNRLGWHKPPTKDPEQTRLNLQSWLPKELHGDINPLLVGFGQTICLPVGPRCDACTLSNGLCPSAAVKKTVKTRKSVSTRAKIEIELEDEKQIYTDNVKVEAVESGKGLLASIIKTES